jgi:hypothetical protein
MLSYALGRRFHQNIRRLPLRTHPEWMTGAENYFQRYGIVSLIVGRFIGPLRPMLPMVAGMCDMPLPRFILVSLLAGALAGRSPTCCRAGRPGRRSACRCLKTSGHKPPSSPPASPPCWA